MKVLVIHDPPLVRQSLLLVLAQLETNLDVLDAASVDDALELAHTHADVDLALIDMPQPRAGNLEALQAFHANVPSVPVVVYSASEDPADITRVLDSGAMGFIPTSHSTRVMIGALRLVLAGGVYLPEVVRHATRAMPPPPAAVTAYQDVGLTERQAQVLALLIQGKPNKLICRDLDLAEGTVKIHVTAILKALKVSNRTQAVLAVNRMGLQLPATH